MGEDVADGTGRATGRLDDRESTLKVLPVLACSLPNDDLLPTYLYTTDDDDPVFGNW